MSETQEKVKTEMARDKNPKTIHIGGVYGFAYNHQNGMKPILDETRLLELFKHINYKIIELVLREI